MIAGAPLNPAYNEFQRADTAPYATQGDGKLDATDFVQQALYIGNLSTPQGANGFFRSQPQPPPFARAENSDPAIKRALRVVSGSAKAGDKVTVSVELDAQGDEVATSFTLGFDPMKLGNPVVTLGADAPTGTTLTANTDSAADGRVSMLIDSASPFSRATARMITITFDVAPTAVSGGTQIEFTSDPTAAAISDISANSLQTRYQNGTITISGSNAAGVEVSGRVTTPDGSGLRNAQVTLTDANGTTRTVLTASAGYYKFDSVAAGSTYTISVASKRYRFQSRKVQVTDNLIDLDFTAQE
jgi:hypothetical protein